MKKKSEKMKYLENIENEKQIFENEKQNLPKRYEVFRNTLKNKVYKQLGQNLDTKDTKLFCVEICSDINNLHDDYGHLMWSNIEIMDKMKDFIVKTLNDQEYEVEKITQVINCFEINLK